MPNLDERVAVVETRVDEHSVQMTEIRTLAAETRQELRSLRDETRQEIRALRNEMREEFRALRGEMGALRDEMSHGFAQVRDEMNRRFERMDHRFDWLVGIVVTGFIAVIGTIAGAFWGLLQTVRSLTP